MNKANSDNYLHCICICWCFRRRRAFALTSADLCTHLEVVVMVCLICRRYPGHFQLFSGEFNYTFAIHSKPTFWNTRGNSCQSWPRCISDAMFSIAGATTGYNEVNWFVTSSGNPLSLWQQWYLIKQQVHFQPAVARMPCCRISMSTIIF